MKRPRLEDRHKDAIIFTEQDAEGVLASHNDTVVITVNIVDYNVHCVFIDNESLIDVLYYSIFSQMRFTPDQLSRFDTPIQGFSEGSVISEEMIKVSVTVGTPSQ